MTQRFSDTAQRLAGQLPRLLGWPPDAFWNATPAELAAILAPDGAGPAAPLTRAEFATMLEQDAHARHGK